MPESKTLHELFVDELKDAYDAEKQLIKALRKMSAAASHPDLSAAFATHLEETNGQVGILEEVFQMLDIPAKGKHCPGIAGIIEEGNEAIESIEKSPVLDAALCGGGKRAEHYEIAAYTTLVAMANELGLDDAAGRLQEILDQEIATDAKLDELSSILLPVASEGEDEGEDEDEGEGDGEEEEEEPEVQKAPAPAKKSAAKKAPAKKTNRR